MNPEAHRVVFLKWFLPLGSFVLLAGSALSGSPQQIPTTPPQAPPIQTQPAPDTPRSENQINPPADTSKPAVGPSAGPGQPVNSSSYKIGPADVLNVRVWNEAEFSGPVAVHEDGMITLALVGDLQAGGSTPVEVEQRIAKALSKYVVKPLVTVTVQQVGSKRYYMDGQIARPGEYALVVPTTILEAISKAGGVAAYGNRKKIYILRGDRRIPFNYKDVLRGKKMDQNILLKSDDHIVVP